MHPHVLNVKPFYSNTLLYWEISANSTIISDGTHPFSANSSQIEFLTFSAYSNRYFIDVLVRRRGNLILWRHKDWRGEGNLAFSDTNVLIFDRRQYESAIGTGNTSDLPVFSRADLDEVLPQLPVPEPDLALYRNPESDSDATGGFLIRGVRNCIRQGMRLLPADVAASDCKDVKITLDLSCCPEAHWQFARIHGDLAVRFLDLPNFPIWMTSQELDDSISSHLPS